MPPDTSTAQSGQAQTSTPPQQQAQQSQTPPVIQPVVISEPQQQAQNPPPKQAADPNAAPNAEQLAQLRQQAERAQQYEQQLQQQSQQYKNLQAEFTRKSQALAQLTGATQPNPQAQDPLGQYAPQIAALKAKGYDDQAARDTVGLFADMVKPLQQEVQQSRAALQGGMQVDAVMQQVYGSNPQLFANQQVYQETRNAMLAQAMHGGQIDPYQAELTAVSLAYAAAKQAAQGQPAQMPWMPQAQPQYQQNPQLPQPFQNGQFNVRPTFQPPTAQPAVVLSPELEKARAEIEARYPKPNTP